MVEGVQLSISMSAHSYAMPTIPTAIPGAILMHSDYTHTLGNYSAMPSSVCFGKPQKPNGPFQRWTSIAMRIGSVGTIR